MNEEKEDKWFVWERSSRGVTSAAIYRGMPVDGSGKTDEFNRFAFKQKLTTGEESMTLDMLKERYPCPEGEVSTHNPRQTPDLTRNTLP